MTLPFSGASLLATADSGHWISSSILVLEYLAAPFAGPEDEEKGSELLGPLVFGGSICSYLQLLP